MNISQEAHLIGWCCKTHLHKEKNKRLTRHMIRNLRKREAMKIIKEEQDND